MMPSAEKVLLNTKEQIKTHWRHAQRLVTLTDHREFQEKVQSFERHKRCRRQKFFKEEDKII